jgi:hypothetical protein
MSVGIPTQNWYVENSINVIEWRTHFDYDTCFIWINSPVGGVRKRFTHGPDGARTDQFDDCKKTHYRLFDVEFHVSFWVRELRLRRLHALWVNLQKWKKKSNIYMVREYVVPSLVYPNIFSSFILLRYWSIFRLSF